MAKKKLLITVGAGASFDFGLPSVACIDKLFDQKAGEIYPLADSDSNLYRYCRDAINAYYRNSPKPAPCKCTNFEEVLYQINLLSRYTSDPDHLYGSNALLKNLPLPDIRDVVRGGCIINSGNEGILNSMACRLMNTLVDYFIDTCEVVSKERVTEIAKLGKFMDALKNEFEIGIITLNYDNLFTQAVTGLHTGFDTTDKFNPMSVLTRTDWNFIYHLHGSVHFTMDDGGHLHDITWTNTPKKNSSHSDGRSPQNSREGTEYPMSPFVAGYGKTEQILRQPFRTYFAQANRLVHEADSLLFLGYGFGDFHLNAIFSEVRDRRRPIVVVDRADDKQNKLEFRGDPWSVNLFETLSGDSSCMTLGSHISIRELKAARELECSTDRKYPLAVWYNGMLEACDHPQEILKHLR